MLSKAGSFNSGTGILNSTQEITIGFQAKVIFFWWSGRTENTDTVGGATQRRGFGVATSTSVRGCFDTRSVDGGAAALASSYIHNAACIMAHTDTTVDGLIDVSAIGATSFTLIVDDVMPYDLRVHYLALGGSDLVNAACGAVAVTANSDVVVSGLSFQPNFAMLVGNTQVTTVPAGNATNCTFWIGMASGVSNMASLVAGTDDASNTMDAATHNTNDYMFGVIDDAVGTLLQSALTFNSFTADGFITDWQIAGLLQGAYLIYVALNCTNVIVGNNLTRTDGNDIVISGLGWKPAAGFVISHCKAETTTTTLSRHDESSIGAFTSETERVAHGVRDQDAAADAQVATAVEHDEVYVNISSADAVEGLMDVKSVDVGGVTFVMDDADPVAAFFGYVLFGPAEVSGVTKTVTDAGVGTDIRPALSASLSRSDSGIGSDINSLSASLSARDSGAGVDNNTFAAFLGLIDAGIGDDIFIDLSALDTVSENGTGSDILSEILASLGITDTSINDDIINLLASLSISDVGLGADALSILAQFLKFVADVGLGTDEIANLLASLSLSEISTITETLAQLASLGLIDIGAGIDSSTLAASLGLIDGGLSTDFLNLSALNYVYELGRGNDTLAQLLASLGIAEGGSGGDMLSLLASLSLSDIGSGSDDISILTALLKIIQDTASGIDGVSISASLSVIDLGNGQDGLSIQVTLSISDEGLGTDDVSISKLVANLIQILDLASGLDGVSISASLNLPELGHGIDAQSIAAQLTGYDVSINNDGLVIQANLSIIDTSSAVDAISLLAATIKIVQDLASGNDFVGQISASLSLDDTGIGTDALGQLLAYLMVTDIGTGVEVVVKYDLTLRIVKISFIINKKAITFAELRAYRIGFSLQTREIYFSLVSGG